MNTAEGKRSLTVLMLGGAKRVSMARMLRDAARRLGRDLVILSYEMDSEVPVACEAEIVTGLRWSDPDVTADLHRLATRRGVDVILPFVDGAVGVAARYAAAYPGEVFVPAVSEALAEAMFDKVTAAGLFERHGLPAPATWRRGSDPSDMPLIAKPRHGSASRGIVAIAPGVDPAAELADLDGYLVQERIDRRREYTVDCYVSMVNGEILAAVPRLRLETAGGEVTRTVTVDEPDVEALARLTLTTLGLRGAVTVQIIRSTDTGRLMLMEINPRLGGGAVTAVHAGADLPLMILTEALGRAATPARWRPNVLIARYMQEVAFIHPDNSYTWKK